MQLQLALAEPFFPLESPAALAARAAGAADWGHCLECGGDVDALAGEVLCRPCDDAAAATEAGFAELAGELLPRVLAELAATRRLGELAA